LHTTIFELDFLPLGKLLGVRVSRGCRSPPSDDTRSPLRVKTGTPVQYGDGLPLRARMTVDLPVAIKLNPLAASGSAYRSKTYLYFGDGPAWPPASQSAPVSQNYWND
jgi:hypothetical protein